MRKGRDYLRQLDVHGKIKYYVRRNEGCVEINKQTDL